MVSSQVLGQAVERLVEASRPSKIILFGSYGRGDPQQDSDVDLLVVVKQIKSRRAETVRLLDVLRPLRISADIVVVTEEQMQEWGRVAGTVLNEAVTEGRVVYEAA